MLKREFKGFVEANRLQFYVERAGDGPTLFYISGTGGDLRNKPNQLDSPLAKYFNLMCFDQRGLGQSAKPAGEYTMANYADDAAALLDQLTDGPVRVIGVSYGGMVAQELQNVAPGAVTTPENPEEMMGVDYSKLVPMLVKEIQSLRARVAELEGE